jgi:heparosan-N-sulfate-glucuronate 5-epimerase
MKTGYYKRILSAYVLSTNSNLSFWHTALKPNSVEDYTAIGRYYMNFADKTKYNGPFDTGGIPVLDYKGSLGLRYNPNAIAQYALGLYDLYLDTKEPVYKERFLRQADWFVKNIRIVEDNIGLWEYNFDFEYHTGLKAPWRSALAQGQGISVLARAYQITKNNIYLKTASMAFKSFQKEITSPGGVTFTDDKGYVWFEELIFNPPTHVLNGFIWALWGVYDYYLLTGSRDALQLFNKAVKTLEDNIHRYDIGFWTVYHLLPTKLKMVASSYYQRLHTVQLEAMYRLTGKLIFKKYSDKWQLYYSNRFYRSTAFFWKCLFKLFYY